MQAVGLKLSNELKRDLEAVIQRHGGNLETVGHPTTTLERLFLRIVEESKHTPVGGIFHRQIEHQPRKPRLAIADHKLQPSLWSLRVCGDFWI